MNVRLRSNIVDKAAKLIPYGFTPYGAVVASLYYYRQANLSDVKSLIRAVRARVASEDPLEAQAPHWMLEEENPKADALPGPGA